MRKVLKRVFVLATCTIFALSLSFSVYANDVESTKGQLSNLQQQKKEMEDKIASLEKEKSNITTYIQKLDKQMKELDGQITSINGQIEETSALLEQTRADLTKAQETQKEQYEIMKSRVKYMFENGSNDYITMLLESQSLEDLLNKAEYIAKISEYDQGLYSRYDATRQDIQKKEEEVSASLDKLNTLQSELTIQKDGLDTLVANKQKEVKAYEDKIAVNQETANSYDKQIDEQEKQLQALIEAERKRQEELKRQEEEKKRKEEEEKKKQEQQAQQNNGGNSSSSSGSDEDNSSNTDDDTISNGSVSFRWPLKVSGTITSRFGYRVSPITGYGEGHNGLDIAVPKGTPIVAAASGTVIEASYNYARGNYVVIYHSAKYSTVYMHSSALKVSVGDKVFKGETIALVGSTGWSTGNHLHFSVVSNGTYVNPEKFVRQP